MSGVWPDGVPDRFSFDDFPHFGRQYIAGLSLLKTPEDLEQVRGLPRPLKQHHGPALLAALERGRRAKPRRSLAPPRQLQDRAKPAVDALLDKLRQRCAQLGVDMTLLTNRREVMRYVCRRDFGHDGEPTRLESGWRSEMVGDLLS